MERLAKLIPRVLRMHGLQEYAEASLVVFHAEKWIGGQLPEYREFLRPRQYRHGVLTISCVHSIAAQECQSVLHDLRAHLIDERGHVDLRDIRLIRQ